MAAEPYNQYDPPTLPRGSLSFWFGTRNIVGISYPVDRVHGNVTRLRILPTLTGHLLPQLFNLFPRNIYLRLKLWLPEWFFPPGVVIKTQKPGWEEEFNDELEMYRRLRSLQGTVIPRYLGTARVAGQRAHILSDVGGCSLPLKGASGIDEPRFRSMLLEALGSLAKQGFIHDDLKLDNFHLVGDRIVVLDLEQMEFVESIEKREFILQSCIDKIAKKYIRHHQIAGQSEGVVNLEEEEEEEEKDEE